MAVDIIGRKKGILLAYGIGTVGMIIVGFSSNLVLAGIGLFLSGFGTNTAVNVCFYFITETVADRERQKHSVLIQALYSLAPVLNVLVFYLIRDWRTIYWAFHIAPSIIILIGIFFLIQDTPYFLIVNETTEEALKSLKKIA